ncbi:hypothetical protein Pyn_28239 [Prunus yedoensis var. nudiflora]|nr:hypothetical protein Pyn_28239 [Prunus yedoensis var. nudiflora]
MCVARSFLFNTLTPQPFSAQTTTYHPFRSTAIVTTHSARSDACPPNASFDGMESNRDPFPPIVSFSCRWCTVRRASLDADFEDTVVPPSSPTQSRCRNLHAAAASFIPPDEYFSSASHKALYHDIVVHRPLLIEDDFIISDLEVAFHHFITKRHWNPLVQGLSLLNFSIVREFYANFPIVTSAIVPGPTLVIRVQCLDIPLTEDSLVVAFGLTLRISPESNPFVFATMERHTLVHLLYIDPPPESL